MKNRFAVTLDISIQLISWTSFGGSDVNDTSHHSEAKRGKLSSMYSCSIVGCSFRASSLTDLDIHLGEHELLDEEQIIQYEIFRQAESPYANSETVEVIDEINLSEPFRKQQKIDSRDHFVLAAEDNEVECKEDFCEKSDLPTDVPSDEGIQRNPGDLRSSIRRSLQNIEHSLENIGIMQLLEIDGYLKRIQQQLCDIQSSNVRYFHHAEGLLQSTVSSDNTENRC